MGTVTFLILFPFLAAVLVAFQKRPGKARDLTVYVSCGLIVAAVVYLAVSVLSRGAGVSYLTEARGLDSAVLAGEAVLMCLIFYYGFRYRKYYVVLLSALQTIPIIWMELSGYSVERRPRIAIDNLTVIMCLVVGVVGSLIGLYTVGYLKDYHRHHPEYPERISFFLSVLFVFLGAMFGLVFSANLSWMYFFWEVTTFCSFLMIGYSRTEIAVHNSFLALWMNLLGGVGFAAAILYSTMVLKCATIQDLLSLGGANKLVVIPAALLAFAAMTKSAQMPFSGWLLGAMVAPTPSSALLHSATMVKAGVYLLIRLSPLYFGNVAGTFVTTIGGFTFFAASLLAISQSDGKRVLAYSTISNLGLIAACAGVGRYEAAWAAVMLVIFHAVSKSLLFLSVGAVENSTGSRDIEDMHGLIVRLPMLAFIMIVGIFGMFLAPFGMLISKWAALKAFVDSKSVLLILFLVFGSGSTLFYWGKWLGKLIGVEHHDERVKNPEHKDQWVAEWTLAGLVIALVVLFPVVSSRLVCPVLVQMFHGTAYSVITQGDLAIVLLMIVMIAVLPIVVRLQTASRKNDIAMSQSYMAGVNEGDDRRFVDSFGGEKSLSLSNWYMRDLFGEAKILRPSLIFATAALVVLLILSIGGAL